MEQNPVDPFIQETFKHVLHHDGTVSFYDAMSLFSADPKYLNAAHSQDEIGYMNFQYGRISRLWGECQNQFLALNYPTRHTQPHTWPKRIVYQLYQRLRIIWKKRCDLVHGKDGRELSKRERRALRKEIKHQFQLGTDGVRGNDKELLHRSKTTVLTYSIRNQKYWIKTLKSSRTFEEDFESSMFSGMRNVMRQWASVPI